MDIPVVGLGTWQATDALLLEKAVLYAVEDLGVRHIDTAEAYRNEEVIGTALQKIFAKGKIKRSDLFITTSVLYFFF
jgi:diketogulonate reductase-like aldo/keto reductase